MLMAVIVVLLGSVGIVGYRITRVPRGSGKGLVGLWIVLWVAIVILVVGGDPIANWLGIS